MVRVLERLGETRGLPRVLVPDNGPEFTGKAMEAWARQMRVRLHFITPAKPAEDGHVESFNRKFRDECLNLHWVLDLEDAPVTIEEWRTYYDRDRPHSALGYMTPLEYMQDMDRSLSWAVV